jgi:hypothetical protein
MKQKKQNWSKAMEKLNKHFALRCGQTVFAVLTLALAFTACKKPAPFTDLNAISTHLAKTKGGGLDKPISMTVNIPLGEWRDIA